MALQDILLNAWRFKYQQEVISLLQFTCLPIGNYSKNVLKIMEKKVILVW